VPLPHAGTGGRPDCEGTDARVALAPAHPLPVPAGAGLQVRLRAILPAARLEATALPEVPALRLALLNGDYPQGDLTREEVRRVMDNPLYWVFCWASGQVLARQLLAQPALVAGTRVLDFGCGSGVVAIAAALAGAAEVIACDSDPLALRAARMNARLNGVKLQLAGNFFDVDGPLDLITAADVLYDSANLCWLQRFSGRARRVLLADSRIGNLQCPPYRQIVRRQSNTLPDLDESPEFREVRIYIAG
jgi:predicted nicotinamide N-methyase